MIKLFDISSKCILGCGLVLALVGTVQGAPAESTLHQFAGPPGDGAYPFASLIKDSAGNLYGTTYYGGNTPNPGCAPSGCGTVFKVAPNGTETVLWSFQFQSVNDGALPHGRMVNDKAGNLYGTTLYGGSNGYGTVFKLTPGGTETLLHTFTEGSDGGLPSGLIRDGVGNLYGTTERGGGTGCGGVGCGTIFKLTAHGTETVLHSFSESGPEGTNPFTAPIRDKAGNLYAATGIRGKNGNGTIFKLAPDGTVTVISNFCQQTGCADGTYPKGDLATDSAGNFYAATAGGGANCGCGTVVKFAPDGTETVLHSFVAGNDGSGPTGGLIVDKAGNLYGTTTLGGGTGCSGGHGCGTVFKIAPNGKERILYSFQDGSDGLWPAAGLLKDNGILYGTASYGGVTGCNWSGINGCGVVFKIAPNGAETAVQSVEAESGND